VLRLGWRLKPFILLLLIAFNTSVLIVMTTATFMTVSRIMTEQISETRLDFLTTNQRQLTDRIISIEETAISISTDFNVRRIANSAPQDIYDYLMLRKDLSGTINNYSFVKEYLTSIQIYTDFFKDSPRIDDRILPLSDIPWKDEMLRLDKENAIWLAEREDKRSMTSTKNVISNVRKIRDTQGRLFGYVEVNMDITSLRTLLTNSRRPHNERVLLILDPENRLMTEIAQPDNGSSTMKKEWLSAGAIGPDQGYRIEELEGERFVFSQTAESMFEWRLIDILPYLEVYESIEKIRNVVILVGLMMLLLTIPLALYLSDKIIRPIIRLVHGFQKIKTGDFAIRLDGHFIFEFQMLSISFNHMADRIRRLLQRVDEEHRLKREAELNALQSQINPHFLYNTLDMINWMAYKKGNTEISMMVSRLAKLFRIGLSKGSMCIPLMDELEHARLYVQLQLSRNRDRFQFEVKVDHDLKRSFVPKIILQPFIENSIIHGFKDQMERQPLLKVYTERVSASRFLLVVEDNGVGLTTEKLTEKNNVNGKLVSSSGSSGYGIHNVRERISMYFGHDYDVVMHNLEHGGVKVSIELPIIDSVEELHALLRLTKGDSN
jgi:two-component system sensor histidine kinase YesM